MSVASLKGTALITGASTGIGAVYADRLAKKGYDLILVARSKDKLQEVAERIATTTPQHVDVLSADLTSLTGVKLVAERLAHDSQITTLVNNAGLASIQTLLKSDPDYLDQIIELNVNALTRLSLAAASAFASRGSGLIINIGSVVAFTPEHINGTYSGSKAYVTNFSIALRNELADKGVRVQLVLPGATATPIWEKSGVSVHDILPSEVVMSTEDMVEASLAGLELGEFVTIPALPDIMQLDAYEKARLALRPNLSRKQPASRYSRTDATSAI